MLRNSGVCLLALALAATVWPAAACAADDAKPLVLHVLRSPESALEPWLHDTTRWFIRQSKRPVEIVFLDARPKEGSPDAKSATSNVVADTPPQPDLVLVETNLEPALFGISVPPTAKRIMTADLVLAAARFPKASFSVAQAMSAQGKRGRLGQAAPDSAVGMYALYLESLAAQKSKRALSAKDFDALSLADLLRDKRAARDRYLLIPDTWCGALKEKGQKLAARYPAEGFLQFRIVGYVPAELDQKRAKLAGELLDFLVLRGQTDPPPKCAPGTPAPTPIATPAPARLQAVYADFKKTR